MYIHVDTFIYSMSYRHMRRKPNTGGRRLHTMRYILFPVCVRFFEVECGCFLDFGIPEKGRVFSFQEDFYYS